MSLTALDENNAFNAVGVRKLAGVVAKSRKECAEIAQQQGIEVLFAAQIAEVAQRNAESELIAARAN